MFQSVLERRVVAAEEAVRASVATGTGASLGAAKGEVETSKRLRDLPRTRRKMVDSTISPQQGP